MHRSMLLLLAGVQGLLFVSTSALASQAWKRAVPYPEASADAAKAAEAVIGEAGSEECLRGKLSNAMVRLSNSCDAAGRSSSICELATNIAGQESELSMGEMLSTSETLLQMLGDEASSR
ncbi:hypothetical protein KR100_14200 [Synechococcus sp. KORDI-100]|nr:hypothetical protein KR100_14200 [Synechococcus sp. KORDI-100]